MPRFNNLPHWNYYRLLEKDLEDCFKFVEPCEKHYGVYSDQFARIILMASTEIENVLNSFSTWSQYKPAPKNITSHYSCVTAKFPLFCEMDVYMPRYSIGMKPWDGWSSNTGPDWWSAGYNKIKHDRINYPDAPTMLRAIKSVGSLLVLLLHFYRLKHPNSYMSTEISPHLIQPWNKEGEDRGAYILWNWELPDEVANRIKPTI